MKTYTKSILLLLIVALFFASCQDESVEIINPDEQQTITANSQLSTLMLRTSSNAVAEDNVLDNSSCFSVELPVTVVVGNITITIENEEGLEELEELLENFQDEIPEFVFPITIISADYTEQVIENQEQLNNLLENCVDNDDVIECIDFVYPISFSLLNSQFVIIDTITIESNEALYEFLESLDDDNDFDFVALNFPVSLVYANGDTVTVNSNEELSDVIEAASEACDDDFEDCDVDDVKASLKECVWKLDDEFDDFDGLTVTFNDDFTLEITGQNLQEPITGNWTVIEDDNGTYLVLSELSGLQNDLGGEWLITDCDEDEFNLVRGDFELELDRYCDNNPSDCSAEDLAENLVECYWFAGTNIINTQDNKLVFTEDGAVKVHTPNGFVEIGGWNISLDANVLILVLDLTGDYAPLSGNWEVVECDEGFYGLMQGDNILHLEQDCFVNPNPFDCFGSFDAVLELCDEDNDGFETFDLTIAYANCTPAADVVTYHTSIADADNNVNAISNPQSYVNTSSPQTIYVRVEIGDNHEVFEILLKVVDCNNGNCTEQDVDGILMNCEWIVTELNGDDNLITYRLSFNDEQELVVTNTVNNETIIGVWTTYTNNDGGVDVTFEGLNAPDIQAIIGVWTVVECTDTQLIFHQGDDQMTLDKDCD